MTLHIYNPGITPTPPPQNITNPTDKDKHKDENDVGSVRYGQRTIITKTTCKPYIPLGDMQSLFHLKLVFVNEVRDKDDYTHMALKPDRPVRRVVGGGNFDDIDFKDSDNADDGNKNNVKLQPQPPKATSSNTHKSLDRHLHLHVKSPSSILLNEHINKTKLITKSLACSSKPASTNLSPRSTSASASASASASEVDDNIDGNKYKTQKTQNECWLYGVALVRDRVKAHKPDGSVCDFDDALEWGLFSVLSSGNDKHGVSRSMSTIGRMDSVTSLFSDDNNRGKSYSNSNSNGRYSEKAASSLLFTADNIKNANFNSLYPSEKSKQAQHQSKNKRSSASERIDSMLTLDNIKSPSQPSSPRPTNLNMNSSMNLNMKLVNGKRGSNTSLLSPKDKRSSQASKSPTNAAGGFAAALNAMTIKTGAGLSISMNSTPTTKEGSQWKKLKFIVTPNQNSDFDGGFNGGGGSPKYALTSPKSSKMKLGGGGPRKIQIGKGDGIDSPGNGNSKSGSPRNATRALSHARAHAHAHAPVKPTTTIPSTSTLKSNKPKTPTTNKLKNKNQAAHNLYATIATIFKSRNTQAGNLTRFLRQRDWEWDDVICQRIKDGNVGKDSENNQTNLDGFFERREEDLERRQLNSNNNTPRQKNVTPRSPRPASTIKIIPSPRHISLQKSMHLNLAATTATLNSQNTRVLLDCKWYIDLLKLIKSGMKYGGSKSSTVGGKIGGSGGRVNICTLEYLSALKHLILRIPSFILTPALFFTLTNHVVLPSAHNHKLPIVQSMLRQLRKVCSPEVDVEEYASWLGGKGVPVPSCVGREVKAFLLSKEKGEDEGDGEVVAKAAGLSEDIDGRVSIGVIVEEEEEEEEKEEEGSLSVVVEEASSEKEVVVNVDEKDDKDTLVKVSADSEDMEEEEEKGKEEKNVISSSENDAVVSADVEAE